MRCSAISRHLWARAGYPTTFGVGAETGAHGRIERVNLAFALQQGDVARGELAVPAEAVGFVAGAGVCVEQVHGNGEGVAAGFGLLADLDDGPVPAALGARAPHQQVDAVEPGVMAPT